MSVERKGVSCMLTNTFQIGQFFLNPVKDRPMAYNAFLKKETINAIVRTESEKIEEKISKPTNNRLLDISNQGMRASFL